MTRAFINFRMQYLVAIGATLTIIFIFSETASAQCGLPGTPPCQKKGAVKKAPAKKSKKSQPTSVPPPGAILTPVTIRESLPVTLINVYDPSKDPTMCLSPDIENFYVKCPEHQRTQYLSAIEDIGFDIAIAKYNKALLRESPKPSNTPGITCYTQSGSVAAVVVPCEGDFLMEGDRLVILRRTQRNSWINVVRLKTGKEGWVYLGHVDIRFSANPTRESPQITSRSTGSYLNPTLLIINDSDRTIHIKVGSRRLTLASFEQTSISLDEGSYTYFVSAPNVYPAIGEKYFQRGFAYTWKFFIGTERR